MSNELTYADSLNEEAAIYGKEDEYNMADTETTIPIFSSLTLKLLRGAISGVGWKQEGKLDDDDMARQS